VSKKLVKPFAGFDETGGCWLAVIAIETSGRKTYFRGVKKEKTGAFSPEILRRLRALPVSGGPRPLISLFGPKLDPLVPAARSNNAMGLHSGQ
jgi:hypothetical protein